MSPALAGPATNFLERCLTYEPRSRITAREALAHTFIDPHAADRAAAATAALAADRAAAAEAARAAAEALVDDVNCDPTKFGGFHSAFTSPARLKRARLVTPPNGFDARAPPLLQGIAALYANCPVDVAMVED